MTDLTLPFRQILDDQTDLVFAFDARGRLLYANHAFDTLGFPRADLATVTLKSLVAPAFYEEARQRVAGHLRREPVPQPWELQIVDARGELIWVQARTHAIYDDDGHLVVLHGIARDIRERKALEERLRAALQQAELSVAERGEALDESERRYQQVAEMLPVMIWEMDLTGRFTYANLSGFQTFGYTPEDLEKGVTVLDLIAPGDHIAALEKMRGLVQGEPSSFSEYTVRHKDGTEFPALVSSAVVRRGGEPVGFRGVIVDISERKEMEEALRESEAKHRQLVEHAPAGIYEVDLLQRRFTSVNDVICEYLGYTREEILQLDPADMLTEESRALFLDRYQRMVGGEEVPDTVKYTVCIKDGREIQVLANIRLTREDGVPVRTSVVMHDISELSRLEEQLHQAQKMKAIGTLAGGVAHDFNNLLMGILGNASLMRSALGAGHPHSPSLRAIEDLVQRAADLTRQLLAFARGGKYEVRPWNPGEILAETAEMFGRTRKEIVIQRQIADGLPPVRVDRGQVEQVLMNVFINAWQAMPDGGTLVLDVRTVDVDRARAGTAGVEPGRYVRFSVADDGCGMTAEVAARAYEPFFTTREPGQGTGLGLASVYGIVRNHDGFIMLDSEVGRGTIVEVFLPASWGPVEDDSRPSRDPERGEGTVLVVDDEDDIRMVTCKMIESLGYHTLEAASGAQALEFFDREHRAIDLVLLDLTMPGVGGIEVFQRLRERSPDMAVLLCSGYSLDATHLLEDGRTGFLQKPYDRMALSLRLREMLVENGDGAQ